MRLQSVPRSKVFWEAKCVSATFSDDYFARYRFLLFCAKKASFYSQKFGKQILLSIVFIQKKGTPSHFERVRREKFFALLSDDLGQLSDIIHFFTSFFAGVCVSKHTGHLELKSYLKAQFHKHCCFHDIFLQISNPVLEIKIFTEN